MLSACGDLHHDIKLRTAPGTSLSVVVVSFAGSTFLGKGLRALLAQTYAHDFEIIVPSEASVSEISVLRNKFPKIRFIAAGRRRTFAELRALGVANARGAIVALTEDHCTPDADWCERILQAHTGSYTVAGGAVEKQSPDTILNWALYLLDYARYMNPRPAGYSGELTDCNVSYKRSALDAITDVWRLEFHEPAVHGALKARGQSLWCAPDMIVHQQRNVKFFDAVKDRYVFGRLFGSGRAGASKGRRLLYGMISVALPALLVGRVAQHVFRRRRHIGKFIGSLPAQIVLSFAWAWGEFLGYVTGRPEASLTPRAQSTNARPRAKVSP